MHEALILLTAPGDQRHEQCGDQDHVDDVEGEVESDGVADPRQVGSQPEVKQRHRDQRAAQRAVDGRERIGRHVEDEIGEGHQDQHREELLGQETGDVALDLDDRVEL